MFADGIPERVNWDKFAVDCRQRDDLTDNQKQRCKEAFLFLEAELGYVPWVIDGVGHPLGGRLIWNSGCLWACDFADALRAIQMDDNYRKLRKRLKKPETFSVALSELNAAHLFHEAGFEVKLEPQVEHGRSRKFPDIKLINKDSGEHLYCEVSMLGDSDKEKRASKTDVGLSMAILLPGTILHFAGRMYRSCSDVELKEVGEKIREFSRKVVNVDGFGTLTIEGILTLSISTESQRERLKVWTDQVGMQFDSFEGPPVDMDHLQRMLGKMAHERRQLSPNHLNVIFVEGGNLLFGLGSYKDPGVIHAAAEVIRQKLLEWPQVLAVIIKGGYMGRPYKNSVETPAFSFIYREKYYAEVEQYMVVMNLAANPAASESTIQKIRQSIFK